MRYYKICIIRTIFCVICHTWLQIQFRALINSPSEWFVFLLAFSFLKLVILAARSIIQGFPCDSEITDASSAHPQLLPPTLCSSCNTTTTIKRKAAVVRTRVGGLSGRSDSRSHESDTFEIFLLKVGFLLGPRSSSVHHCLLFTPLSDKQKHKRFRILQHNSHSVVSKQPEMNLPELQRDVKISWNKMLVFHAGERQHIIPNEQQLSWKLIAGLYPVKKRFHAVLFSLDLCSDLLCSVT